MEISEMIGDLIENYGFSQKGIAEEIDSTQATVSRIQNKITEPTYKVAQAIINLHNLKSSEKAA